MSSTPPYDTIARYYDLEHAGFRDDLDFYRSMVHSGPILEIGAGTGRITVELAQVGLEIWGVEPNVEMAARARTKLASLESAHLVEGTLDDLPTGLEFEAVILSLNTLWHVPAEALQLELLRNAGSHLKAGGLLLVGCSNPLTMADRSARGDVRERFHERVDSGIVIGYSSAWDDEAEQMLDLFFTYEEIANDGSVKKFFADLRLRYLYRAELEMLLEKAGFKPEQIYGDYDLEPFDADSPQILVVASRLG